MKRYSYNNKIGMYDDDNGDWCRVDGWISVKDRLPVESDNKKGMLLYLKNTRGFEWQQIGEFDGNSFGVQDEQTICHCLMDDETVTHWQPLPEPPKESLKPKD